MPDIEIYEANLTEFLHDPAGPVGDIMLRATLTVENRAKEELLRPGTGRTYTTSFRYRHFNGEIYLREWGSGHGHTSSAPGESPASDTGSLLASTTHYMEETPDGPVGHVGSPEKVALFTELGTQIVPPPGPGEPGHHGMIERPWLRPALDALNGEVFSD